MIGGGVVIRLRLGDLEDHEIAILVALPAAPDDHPPSKPTTIDHNFPHEQVSPLLLIDRDWSDCRPNQWLHKLQVDVVAAAARPLLLLLRVRGCCRGGAVLLLLDQGGYCGGGLTGRQVVLAHNRHVVGVV